METIALLVTGALGMLGWFFAWVSQRAVVAKGAELAAANAGEGAARTVALTAEGKAAVAQAQVEAAKARADSLQAQLDAERKSRASLVDALSKKGVPVGDVVVDSALDRLFPDGRGQGAGSSGSGDPVAVSGQPTASSRSSSQR